MEPKLIDHLGKRTSKVTWGGLAPLASLAPRAPLAPLPHNFSFFTQSTGKLEREDSSVSFFYALPVCSEIASLIGNLNQLEKVSENQ